MVALQDNDTINKQSRSYYDSLTPGQQMLFIIDRLARNDEELTHLLKINQFDFNEFADDAASGIVTVQNPTRYPLMITDVLATWSQSALPNSGNSIFAQGSVTSPGAFGGIASTVTLPAGTWNITAQLYLGGTIGAGDANNAELVWGGASNAVISYPAITNNLVTYTVQINLFSSQTHTVTLQTIAAGTVGSVYTGTITATPLAVNSSFNAVLTIGGRRINLPYSQGQFQALGMHGLQLDNTGVNAKATLSVSPACPVHLELAGYADYRKNDRN